MKKIMMMLVATVSLGAGFANAGETAAAFDFDGKGIGARNFMEAIKAPDSCRNDNIACEQPKPTPVSVEITGAPMQPNINGAAKKEEPVFNPRMVVDMDASIGSAIAYVNEHRLGAPLRSGFECLRNQGTLKQKYDFVYAEKGSTHTFPDNCMQPLTKAPGVCSCREYSWRDVCHDVTTYHDVCKVIAGACVVTGMLGGVPVTACAPAYMLCEAIATITPSCIPQKYCSDWHCEPPIGG